MRRFSIFFSILFLMIIGGGLGCESNGPISLCEDVTCLPPQVCNENTGLCDCEAGVNGAPCDGFGGCGVNQTCDLVTCSCIACADPCEITLDCGAGLTCVNSCCTATPS